MSGPDQPVAPVVPLVTPRTPFDSTDSTSDSTDDPKPVVECDAYFSGLRTAKNGEVIVTFGVPFDQADAAWPLRQLEGYTIKLRVYR